MYVVFRPQTKPGTEPSTTRPHPTFQSWLKSSSRLTHIVIIYKTSTAAAGDAHHCPSIAKRHTLGLCCRSLFPHRIEAPRSWSGPQCLQLRYEPHITTAKNKPLEMCTIPIFLVFRPRGKPNKVLKLTGSRTHSNLEQFDADDAMPNALPYIQLPGGFVFNALSFHFHAI